MANISELKVTPSQLKSKAQSFQQESNKVKTTTKKMLDLINKINGATWSGDAAKAYKNKFAKLEGDMNQMHKMINEYSTDLIEIANQYESTEQANQAIASALATDVIK